VAQVADGSIPGAGGQAPEDEFDRALRALTEGTAGEARFRELSAAERERAGAAAAKAARRQAEELARAVKAEQKRARRRGQSWDEPARPHGGRARTVVAIIAAIALIGAGLFALQRFSRPLRGGASGSHPATGGVTPSGTAPAPQPSTAPGPPTDPFAGTPADHWANGADGIIIPAAKPVGRYSAAQVASAYATTKKLLIAALLDKQTLLGGEPTAFANLLNAKQRAQFLAGLNTQGTYANLQPRSTRAMVVSFAPGSARLIGPLIKVHGSMKAGVGHENGQDYLFIDVSYTSVYPVERPGAPSDWMRIVADKYGAVAFAHFVTLNGPLEPFDDTIVGDAGGLCPRSDGFIHPDYPSLSEIPVPSHPGPAIDPYNATNAATPGPTQGSGTACDGSASYT
jgi:hypothetical protein